MAGDDYLLGVIGKYQPTGDPRHVGPALAPVIRRWAGTNVIRIAYSGSYAKGTAVRFNTDIDLLISLASEMPGTLKDMYESLFSRLETESFAPRC